MLSLAVLATLLLPGGGARAATPDPQVFRRGDANADGMVDLGDAVKTVFYIYLGGVAIPCLDAADSNDANGIEIGDVIFTLSFLFLGGLPPDLPGPYACGTDPTADALSCDSYPADCTVPPPDDIRQIGHVLNRLGYGPTQAAVDHVREVGIGAYIEEQLHPESIDESGNTAFLNREKVLFDEVPPAKDRRMVSSGDIWMYFKGSVEPPATWKDPEFVAASPQWRAGATPIGYGPTFTGNNDTLLNDMMNTYASVYIRKVFNEPSRASVHSLVLRIDYDDGFVAYLNGFEVARSAGFEVVGTPPLHTALCPKHDPGLAEFFDITAKKGLLVPGANVLAIQAHNNTLGSGDLVMNPELIDREILPGPMLRIVKGVNELQELTHIRGIYSEKQLQAVLGEFWENHFTTDLDKVADYFNALQDSDATDSMGDAQSRREAAQVEYRENQFFYDNAFGNFGDLLLASATSPSMLMYLDNVLNVAGNANENYSREVLELFAFGVDNRYAQKDIEQLAKCFTGWSICKVTQDNAPPFPLSATSPPEQCGVLFQDTSLIPDGPGWKCFRGTAEPSPDPGDGHPTTAWTALGFDDGDAGLWLNGSILTQTKPPKGIGYGDGDDTNIPNLSDMQHKTNPAQTGYASVYIRRQFEVPDPSSIKNLLLEVAYDDAYVAYLNGEEVARSKSMGAIKPPAHDTLATDIHEVTEGKDLFNLNRFKPNLIAGTNVLAIEVHNVALDSSDLSMIPSLVDREILPGSIENSDPSGVWTFHFDPAKHDISAKTLFDGTPNKITIPANRTGMAGLQDALDVVQKMASHPSTKEFICIKLIQKFVSDQITLATYKAQTAPIELRELLSQAILAWDSTTPPGNIRTVMEAILDPLERKGEFWAERNYRSKVKTAEEFVNSTIRVLDGNVVLSGSPLNITLPAKDEAMGMTLFLKDEPDGYSELGIRWIDTARMLSRISFAQTFAENLDSTFTWNISQHILKYGLNTPLDTAQKIVDHFNDLLFQGTLSPDEKARLLEFLTTDPSYNPLPLNPAGSDFTKRVQEFVGLCLSLPQWNYQ